MKSRIDALTSARRSSLVPVPSSNRDRLDPTGVLANAYLDRVLGVPAAVG